MSVVLVGGIFKGKLWSLSNSLLFMTCIKALLNNFASCPKRSVLFPHCRIYNRIARYVTQREIRHLRGRKSGALCLPWDWVGQPFLRQLPRLRINQGLLTITQVRLSQNTTWSSFIFYLFFQTSARKENRIVRLSKTFFQLKIFTLPKPSCVAMTLISVIKSDDNKPLP